MSMAKVVSEKNWHLSAVLEVGGLIDQPFAVLTGIQRKLSLSVEGFNFWCRSLDAQASQVPDSLWWLVFVSSFIFHLTRHWAADEKGRAHCCHKYQRRTNADEHGPKDTLGDHQRHRNVQFEGRLDGWFCFHMMKPVYYPYA